MKKSSRLKRQTFEDRIARAEWLIGNGYVQSGNDGNDSMRCWSQRYGDDLIYTVTAYSCTCWEGQNRRKRICKHRWACFAPAAVLLVMELRTATDEQALERIGLDYKEAVGLLEPIYVNAARDEYVKCRDKLREAAA